MKTIPILFAAFAALASGQTSTGGKLVNGKGGGITDVAAFRTALGLGTAATTAATSYAPTSHGHALGDLTQSGATSGQFPQWNGSAWVPVTGTGGTSWGSITGTLASQTDLNSALAAKAPIVSPTFTTPALGIPSAGVLTSCTGLPLTSGITGILAGANGGTGVANSGKTLTLASSITTTGTANATFAFPSSGSPSYTFPTTSATLARTDSAQTFLGKLTATGQGAFSTLSANDMIVKSHLDEMPGSSTLQTANLSFSTTSPATTTVLTSALSPGTYVFDAVFILKNNEASGSLTVRTSFNQAGNTNFTVFGEKVCAGHQGNPVSYTMNSVNTTSADFTIAVGSPNYTFGVTRYRGLIICTSAESMIWTITNMASVTNATTGKMYILLTKY